VLDGQAKALWDAPVHTGALRWGAWSRRFRNGQIDAVDLPAAAAFAQQPEIL